jgi:hypothetical protein
MRVLSDDGYDENGRMLFGRYSRMSRDDRLMADMLGTYLINCVP